MAKTAKRTFTVILKPMLDMLAGEPYVGIEIEQPVCFGHATLILNEADISRWEGVLQKGRAMIRKAKEESDGILLPAGEPECRSNEAEPDRLLADPVLDRRGE